MKKHIGVLLLAALIVGSLLVYTVSFQVDELRDIVLIERFGRVDRTYSGAEDAGLKFKWPWPVEKAIRYDSRSFVFEDPYSETTTKDKQNMLVTTYAAWKIEDPIKFHKAIRSDVPSEKVKRIQQDLRDMLRDEKSDVVGEHDMTEFINTDPQQMHLPKIEADIMERFRKKAMRDYGVHIVRVGIKSLGLPEQVTQSVIAAMKAERQRDMIRYQTQGEAEAQGIEQRAKSARDQILAFAERKAKNIRTEGDQAAAQYYQRFQEDPEFSIFLRSLESLKRELSSNSVIVLDGSSLPAVRWLREGPSLPVIPKEINPQTAE